MSEASESNKAMRRRLERITNELDTKSEAAFDGYKGDWLLANLLTIAACACEAACKRLVGNSDICDEIDRVDAHMRWIREGPPGRTPPIPCAPYKVW